MDPDFLGSAARDAYIDERKQQLQNMITNVRSSSSLTNDASIWTFRSTGCDILSVIMTTVPIKNGTMKDIKLRNKEMRR